MATMLLTRAREDAGLSKAELARRAHTSRTTLSAYEHGSKTPTVTTLERLIGAAGYDLALQPRPSFAVAGQHRGAPVLVPNQLPALPPAQALARIELPLHLEWSSANRTKDLAVRDERIRVYELVLREGTPDDVLLFVDPTLLLDAFEELNLPAAIRAAWQPALARWRGR